MPENKDDKKKIEIEIIRKNGKTIFKFKVDPRLTEIYKGLSTEVRESNSWKNLKFYYMPNLTDDENYRRKLYNLHLIDDYGTGLYKNGFLNIAWLRTVGGTGELTIADSLSFADLSILIKNATQFIKQHFEEHYSNFRIKGQVTLEI